MFWLMAEPLIRAGKVLVFPDPDEINLEFQHAMREMALERTDNWHPEPNDLGEFHGLAEDDRRRRFISCPTRALIDV